MLVGAILLNSHDFVKILLGFFYVILENFYRLAGLPNLHERTQVNKTLVKLDNIIRTIHVDEQFLFLKFNVLIFGGIIAERSLRATEMASQNQELVTL